MTAEEYSTQLRPIIGDKNFTLNEKMELIAQTMEQYHEAKVKNSRLQPVSSIEGEAAPPNSEPDKEDKAPSLAQRSEAGNSCKHNYVEEAFCGFTMLTCQKCGDVI